MNEPDVGQTAALAGRLIDALDSPRFLDELQAGLAARVAFDNFIVYAYRKGFAADLVASSLDLDYLRAQMQPYTLSSQPES